MSFGHHLHKEHRLCQSLIKIPLTFTLLTISRWSVFDHSCSRINVEIKFGEGGEDSKLFVHDLCSTYLKYCSAKNLKADIASTSHGHILLDIRGSSAGGLFSAESGKHVLQRCPPTEKRGRVHTSTIYVIVTPFKSIRKISAEELLKDSDITTLRRGGKGGQHQNTTDSAVRMVHNPTGFSVLISGRKQNKNKEEAKKLLLEKVNNYLSGEQKLEKKEHRTSQMGGDSRADKIRTYNFPLSMVINHLNGKKTSNINAVMKGDLDIILG